MPGRPPAPPGLGRLVASGDFERVLGQRSVAATAHFAVHYLDAQPAPRPAAPRSTRRPELSTFEERASAYPVEDFLPVAPHADPVWVGAVVPKRHAKRAVTRSLLKRQIYAAAARHGQRLAPGLWIVRLRAPLDRARFPGAASTALRRDKRAELDALLASVPSRR